MLKRSLSLSEIPVSQRVSTEEHKLNASGHTLIKHYSCEQILYSANKIRIEQIVQEVGVTNDKISSWKSWAVKYEGSASSLKKYCEDLKGQSPKTNHEPFYSMERKNKPTGPKALRPLRSSSNSTEQRKNSILFVFLPIIFIVAAVIACSSLYFVSYQRVCEMALDVGAVESALISSIIGQEDAIYKMVSTLHAFCSSREPGTVIIVLLGGTGVGKSYTTSIISDHFSWEKNVQHFIFPFHSNSLSVTDVVAKFSSCGDNLVVMDDLVPGEATDIIKFLQNLINHSQEHDVRVIIILVFNNEDQKMVLEGYGDLQHQIQVSKEKLCSFFQDAKLDITLITFQPLQREHIMMCIKDALSQKGIMWSSTEIEQVMALLPQDTGCKGVTSKIQLFIAFDTTDV